MDALNHIDHGWTMPNLKMAPRNLGPWRIPTLNRNGVWWNGPKLSDFQALDFWIRGVGVGKLKASRSTGFKFSSLMFSFWLKGTPFWGVKLPNVLQVMDWKVAMKKRTAECFRLSYTRKLLSEVQKWSPQMLVKSLQVSSNYVPLFYKCL